MQRFKDRLRIAWIGKQIQYSYLKVSLEAVFFRNDLSKQKSFHLLTRELHNECSASISVEIHSRDPMKNSTLAYFCKSTYSHMHRNSIEDNYSLLQVEISHPHITSPILLAKAFKNLWREWLRKFLFTK